MIETIQTDRQVIVRDTDYRLRQNIKTDKQKSKVTNSIDTDYRLRFKYKDR